MLRLPVIQLLCAAPQDAGGNLVPQYSLATQAEFEAKNNCKAPAGKRYFSHTSLPDIISVYPFKQVG